MRIYYQQGTQDDAAIQPNTVEDYELAIQSALKTLFAVPVYKNYNQNFAQQPTFVTWQLRSLQRQVFTGTPKVLGIEMPRAQISIYAQNPQEGSQLAQTLIEHWNGFTGHINPANIGPVCGKITVDYLYQTFDDKYNLTQTILDVAFYVTGAPN